MLIIIITLNFCVTVYRCKCEPVTRRCQRRQLRPQLRLMWRETSICLKLLCKTRPSTLMSTTLSMPPLWVSFLSVTGIKRSVWLKESYLLIWHFIINVFSKFECWCGSQGDIIFELIGVYPSEHFFYIDNKTGIIYVKKSLREDVLQYTTYTVCYS